MLQSAAQAVGKAVEVCSPLSAHAYTSCLDRRCTRALWPSSVVLQAGTALPRPPYAPFLCLANVQSFKELTGMRQD